MAPTGVLYSSSEGDILRGTIDIAGGEFYAMFTTNGYTQNRDTHTRRSDITNEISGTGYTAGGAAIPVAISSVDNTNDRQEITVGPITITGLTASNVERMVVYQRIGGASTGDPLLVCVSNSAAVSPAAGTLTVPAFTIRRAL